MKFSRLGACALFGLATVAMAARQMEYLDRGVVAVQTGGGVYVGWRVLGTENSSTAFNVYRGSTKVNGSPITSSSNLLDASGTAGSTYSVRPVVNGVEQAGSPAVGVNPSQALGFAVSAPAKNSLPDGSSYTYNIADGSTGDLDGDGKLDLVIKWDPSNMKDNSLSGYTGDVWLDGYTLQGKRLFRIDLGKNIRAGNHYTQFVVADFDSDGKAEIMVKTAPGTKDGTGKLLSLGAAAGADHSKDYRNSKGYVLSGPEWLTVFGGADGKELATVNYTPGRGTVSAWGDSYGNRVDRFLASAAWLDGVKPSGVFQRGYYTRMAVTAYDWNGTTLSQRWAYDAKTSGSECYGQGNHNLSVADVDGDGKDEIIQSGCAIDDNGKFMYRTGLGHGDAMHLGDLDPDHAGLEVYSVHEETSAKYGYEMHDAKTGAILWGVKTGTDNGRGLAADVDSAQRGYESWSFGSGVMQNAKGTNLGASRGTINFRAYWDGDLQDEAVDYERIEKLVNGKWGRIFDFSAFNGKSYAGCKYIPSLVADLFGDWREEIVMGTSDMDSIKIFTTTAVTPYRFYTLMHDPVYRAAVSWQNSAYNQPPHPGFWLGAGPAKAPQPSIVLTKAPTVVVSSSSAKVSSSSVASSSSAKVSSSSVASSSSAKVSSSSAASSSSAIVSSSSGGLKACIAFVNGVGGYASNCYKNGLSYMAANTCYTMNKKRGEVPAWINNNANDTWWWTPTSCTGFLGRIATGALYDGPRLYEVYDLNGHLQSQGYQVPQNLPQGRWILLERGQQGYVLDRSVLQVR